MTTPSTTMLTDGDEDALLGTPPPYEENDEDGGGDATPPAEGNPRGTPRGENVRRVS